MSCSPAVKTNFSPHDLHLKTRSANKFKIGFNTSLCSCNEVARPIDGPFLSIVFAVSLSDLREFATIRSEARRSLRPRAIKSAPALTRIRLRCWRRSRARRSGSAIWSCAEDGSVGKRAREMRAPRTLRTWGLYPPAPRAGPNPEGDTTGGWAEWASHTQRWREMVGFSVVPDPDDCSERCKTTA